MPSGDLKVKLKMAVDVLVGPAPILDRLKRATHGVSTLSADDFSPDSDLGARFERLRQRLTARKLLLHDEPPAITDEEGRYLSQELLAIFAIACDPYEFRQIAVEVKPPPSLAWLWP
jgi:hypothetical protein